MTANAESITTSPARGIEGAVKKIKIWIKENNYNTLNDDDIWCLYNIKQTQNYSEGFEFYIEEVKS